MAWVVRTKVQPSIVEQRDPGAAAPGERAAGVGRAHDE